MDGAALRALATEMGLAGLYDRGQGLKDAFDEITLAVESLPTQLIDRGRELPYPQLHWAVRNGDLEMVKALLENKVDPDGFTYLEDDEDEGPMAWLARSEEVDFSTKRKIAKLFFAKGADLSDALIAAEDEEDEDFAEFLREHGDK